MNEQLERGRYRREDGKVIIEVAVKNSRQLFNVRDPAPFRERDLDEDFVTYVVSSVQEFPLKTEMKLRIVFEDENSQDVNRDDLQEAIRAHFTYESRLARAKMRKRLRTGWVFLVVGILVLFFCVGVAQLIGADQGGSRIAAIVREGIVIIGWVAMWRPVEVFLYDWWPLREHRLNMDKLATMGVDILCVKTGR